MGKTFPQGQPPGYNKTLPQYPAPTFSDNLGAKANWDTNPKQFGPGPSPIPKLMASDTVDSGETMNFKAASSNPNNAPLPLGRSYSEFPASLANESRPRSRFQDKVDSRTIHKGNPGTASMTGR